MSGGTRAAVVIGNGEYAEGRLVNPAGDAAAIDARLTELGFETVFGRDLTRDGLFGVMDDFRERFTAAEVSLLFYAGHGLQHESRNYLVPVDSRVRRAADIARFGVDVNQFLEMFEEVAGTSIAFLDCCRDNPFLDRILANTKAEKRDLLTVRPGLAGVAPPIGTMIAYATGPDSTADDGGGDHSPFTQALLTHLGRPNESILDAMIDVTNEVLKLTNNRQRPWCQQTLREKFVLNVCEVVPAPPVAIEQEADEAAWLAISASNTISVFDEFVRAYPASRYREHAQSRIEQIQATNKIQQALASTGLPSEAQVIVPLRPFDRGRPASSSPSAGMTRKAPGLGQGNMVDPAFLEGLVAISLFSVAKIVIGEGRGIGTAFFVAGRDLFGAGDDNLYALTSAHVIGTHRTDFAARPRDALLLFDEMNARGIPTPALEVADVVWQSEPWGAGCDASILALGPDRPDFIRPLPIAADLPEIDGDSPLSFATRPRVITISYPYGGRLKFGTNDNFLLDYDRPLFDDDGQPVDRVIELHHTAATEPGSSGCPLLDENLEVIGIHLGGRDGIPRLNGQDGRYSANFGVWIRSVVRAARR